MKNTFIFKACTFGLVAAFAPQTLAGFTSSLGVESTFVEPIGWNVGDADTTHQVWDNKSSTTGNAPDQGYTLGSGVLSAPTHDVKAPGFKSGTNNFYAFGGTFGTITDIYNYGGSSGSGVYPSTAGTHVIIQAGTGVNFDSSSWSTGGELVAGHGVGNWWDSLQIVDLSGNAIAGGDNASALQIAELNFRTGVPSSFGLVSYQEVIYEFWLEGYTGDFRIDFDQAVHATIDTFRVDSIIADEAVSGGTPFDLVPVPEPSSLALLGLAGLAALGRSRR